MATTNNATTQGVVCPHCKVAGYCVTNDTTVPSNPVAVTAGTYYHCENCQANFTSTTAYP